MKTLTYGRRCAAVLGLLVVLASVFTYADTCYLGVFTATEGVTSEFVLYDPPAGRCQGGVLSYVVKNAHGNTASFLNVHEDTLQMQPALTGMTSGRRQTQVDATVTCNGATTVCDAVVYFKVLPAATTSSTTTTTTTTTAAPTTVPTMTCKTTTPVTVANYVTEVIPSSDFTTTCDSPVLSITTQTDSTGVTTSFFSVLKTGSTNALVFNENGDSVANGSYTASIKVTCGALSCITTQQVTVSGASSTSTPAPTTTSTARPTVAPDACPGDYSYALALNKDGTFTAQTSSLASRAAASGSFCAAGGQITSTIGQPSHGVATSNGAAGTFTYTPTTAAAADSMDSFSFTLTCSADETQCISTAVISIVAADSDDIYYSMEGAITCRGTCDAAAWRANPDDLTAFDVSDSGVAVTARKDGSSVDDIDFDFTVGGELLIRAYTSIGNLAARFVTFFPITAEEAEGYVTSSSVPSGSHVSFEPACLDEQATTGAASSIWTWTDLASLKGHLNMETDAYKSGDNYYQKFGGNHRQCDVYRTNPCKYAPFMTPTLNDDTNNVDNRKTPSVQWKLYVNDCDATWVGRASVESLRALRQPDRSATFTLEENGAYLVGTVYSQSVKPKSWTSPSAGVVHTEHAYAVRLKIHNTIVVDAVAQSISTAVVAADAQLSLNSDVQFAAGKDKITNERLYAYSLLLYPVFTANSSALNVTNSKTTVSAFWLLNETWTSPSHIECPTCTGTEISCVGTGDGYSTNCGDAALMTFEAIDYDSATFENLTDGESGTNVFASTTLNTQNAYRITFAARAVGKNTAASTDAYPVGTFALAVQLSNKQVFHIVLNQTDYISELNTRLLNMDICRPSAYWPVPDPLGSSVPVSPYSATNLAFPAGTTTSHEEEEEEEEEEAYYGAPERLTKETCAAAPNRDVTHVQLNSMTGTVTSHGESKSVSMCAVVDERTFGVTDWVMISIPSIQEELEKVTAENIGNIIEDSQLANDNAYTVATLMYLTLTVPAVEVGSSLIQTSATGEYLSFLLDGDEEPAAERSEEATWMHTDSSSSSASLTTYLPWEVYASSLSYRRIGLHTSGPSAISEPFNFAFIPGSLLHSASSARVQASVRASIRFTTYSKTTASATQASQVVKQAEREESLLYIVSLSRGISASLRFDADAYNPVTRTPGIGSKSATAILTVLFIAIVVVLAASVYTEVTFKRRIHNAKYHPKRVGSAVGIRYGRDGKPKENQKTAKEGSRTEAAVPSSTSRARVGGAEAGDSSINTKFGTVWGEQPRVRESVAGSSSSSSVAPAADGDGSYSVINPPVGNEQIRVADDEVAEM